MQLLFLHKQLHHSRQKKKKKLIACLSNKSFLRILAVLYLHSNAPTEPEIRLLCKNQIKKHSFNATRNPTIQASQKLICARVGIAVCN